MLASIKSRDDVFFAGDRRSSRGLVVSLLRESQNALHPLQMARIPTRVPLETPEPGGYFEGRTTPLERPTSNVCVLSVFAAAPSAREQRRMNNTFVVVVVLDIQFRRTEAEI